MTRAPWHHWPVSIAALLWHAAGCADYLLVQFEVPAYTALFTPDQVAYFTGLPAWVDATWAVGVWVGLLGSWLLFKRRALAPLVLLAALLAVLVLSVWLTLISAPPMQAVTGDVGLYLMLGSSVLSALFYLYARATHEPS